MKQAEVMFANTDGEACAECKQVILRNDAVIIWKDKAYDTLACYQDAYTRQEQQEGLDHIAARDQAVAAVRDALAYEPSQFLFVFEPPHTENEITTTVFSTPGFVMEAVAALVEGVATHEPTINPPPDRKEPDE